MAGGNVGGRAGAWGVGGAGGGGRAHRHGEACTVAGFLPRRKSTAVEREGRRALFGLGLALLIAVIASETTSFSSHLPGSTHAVRTDEERSVLMPILFLSSSVVAYSTLPAVSLTYAMSPLSPLTPRLIVPVSVS